MYVPQRVQFKLCATVHRGVCNPELHGTWWNAVVGPMASNLFYPTLFVIRRVSYLCDLKTILSLQAYRIQRIRGFVIMRYVNSRSTLTSALTSTMYTVNHKNVTFYF